MDHQADNDRQVLCQGCGKAFTAFLTGIAEHNAKVVCPHCGKVHVADEAAAPAKTETSDARKPGR